MCVFLITWSRIWSEQTVAMAGVVSLEMTLRAQELMQNSHSYNSQDYYSQWKLPTKSKKNIILLIEIL